MLIGRTGIGISYNEPEAKHLDTMLYFLLVIT